MKIFRLFFALLIAGYLFPPDCYAQISVGDTMSFWSVTYIDWPPLAGTPQRRIHATCDKVGEYCYVFREDTLAPFPQHQIDTLVHRFDKHFVPELTSVYGPMPDALDGDSHVFILIFNEEDWCGYWDPAQQMTDSMVFATWGSHSNENEIIYIASDCFNSAPGITAHEFGHMLHWGRDHSPEPAINPVQYWEDAWIDEGFSTFAAIYLTENIFEPDVIDYQAFFEDDPDIPLIYFSDYNQVKLWTLFMFEHYGGWSYISALISNQLNGIAGMDSTLRQINAPVTFDEAFQHWAITNYLDDGNFEGGKYRYSHYNFNPCYAAANHFTYPTGFCAHTINPYGTDYINFSTTVSSPMTITFSGDSNSKFRLAMIKMNMPANSVADIDYITPDENNNAVYHADSFGVAYNKLVFVVCNVDSAIHEDGTAAYSYFTNSTAGMENLASTPEISIWPNPADSQITVKSGPKLSGSVYTICNQIGKVVSTGKLTDENTIIEIQDLSDGIYLFSIGDNIKHTFKVLKN